MCSLTRPSPRIRKLLLTSELRTSRTISGFVSSRLAWPSDLLGPSMTFLILGCRSHTIANNDHPLWVPASAFLLAVSELSQWPSTLITVPQPSLQTNWIPLSPITTIKWLTRVQVFEAAIASLLHSCFVTSSLKYMLPICPLLLFLVNENLKPGKASGFFQDKMAFWIKKY